MLIVCGLALLFVVHKVGFESIEVLSASKSLWESMAGKCLTLKLMLFMIIGLLELQKKINSWVEHWECFTGYYRWTAVHDTAYLGRVDLWTLGRHLWQSSQAWPLVDELSV
jgi:hypothetical protein